MPDKVFVSGDWEWNDTLDCYETAYEAVRVGAPWNGFATPVVTPVVMTAIIGRQMMFAPIDPQIAWDGNGVIVRTEGQPDEFLMPDADGNFDLSPLGWTWCEVSEDDNVVRKIPVDDDESFNPRAEALAAGTVLGQFEDHKDDCDFATGASVTCTC